MNKIWSVLLLILITHHLGAQDEGNIELIKEQVSKFGQAEIIFNNPGREGLAYIPRNISVTKILGNYAWAKVSAFDVDDMPDFPYPYKVVDRTGEKAVESASSVEEAMNWNKYPTYQQYDTIMRKLAEDYPNLCSLETIGESVEGRKIYALKISDNAGMDEDEPQVFYSSTMHGDELAGYVLMLRLAEHLLINASNGGLEQQLVDSLQIWINPNANPDGTYAGGDTIIYSTRVNANGFDMNRYFPDVEAGITPPAGAPEISDMVQFIKNHRFVISANFHSGAELVNYPWDKWLEPQHVDSLWFKRISRTYADTVHYYSSNQYYFDDLRNGITHGATWYAVRGGRQDFVTFDCQGREVTIELHEDDNTLASLLPTLWNDNHRSLMNYLANAFYGIHGTVVDDETDLPVEARIFIQGHDADSSHVYSDAIDGNFVRLLNEGTWTLAISADGYYTKYVSNIQTVDNQQTRLSIRLIPDGTGFEELGQDELKMWPVPAGDLLYIEQPGGFLDKTELSLYSINGTLLSKKEYNPAPGSYIELDISGIPPGIYMISIRDQVSRKILKGRFVKN